MFNVAATEWSEETVRQDFLVEGVVVDLLKEHFSQDEYGFFKVGTMNEGGYCSHKVFTEETIWGSYEFILEPVGDNRYQLLWITNRLFEQGEEGEPQFFELVYSTWAACMVMGDFGGVVLR